MNYKITGITAETRQPWQAHTMSDLRPVAAAIATLVEMFGTLPAARFNAHAHLDARLDLAVDVPADFEAWRVALQVPADTVDLRTYAGDTWLVLEATVAGVAVQLCGYGLNTTALTEDSGQVPA